MIERRPDGLLSILDEECTFPKATDKSLADKLIMHLGKNRYFEKARFSNLEFVVRHYAARVTYHVQGFLEKNSDYVVAEQQQVMDKSRLPLLLELFAQATLVTPVSLMASPRAKRANSELPPVLASSPKQGLVVPAKPPVGSPGGSDIRGAPPKTAPASSFVRILLM